MTTLEHLQYAHNDLPGHQSRAIRDAILRLALGSITLAAALEACWNGGYAAKEAEERDIASRFEPSAIVQARARAIIARVADEAVRVLAIPPWTWHDDYAQWAPSGYDSSIRPSKDGRAVILMEAGGEWSGVVYTEDGGRYPFDDGSFR